MLRRSPKPGTSSSLYTDYANLFHFENESIESDYELAMQEAIAASMIDAEYVFMNVEIEIIPYFE